MNRTWISNCKHLSQQISDKSGHAKRIPKIPLDTYRLQRGKSRCRQRVWLRPPPGRLSVRLWSRQQSGSYTDVMTQIFDKPTFQPDRKPVQIHSFYFLTAWFFMGSQGRSWHLPHNKNTSQVLSKPGLELKALHHHPWEFLPVIIEFINKEDFLSGIQGSLLADNSPIKVNWFVH